MQPIKEFSSAAGLCAGRGCALIRQLANGAAFEVAPFSSFFCAEGHTHGLTHRVTDTQTDKVKRIPA